MYTIEEREGLRHIQKERLIYLSREKPRPPAGDTSVDPPTAAVAAPSRGLKGTPSRTFASAHAVESPLTSFSASITQKAS